jgi:glyoxylase-like metal-dependent hydrolase (beta-lactamase superfamily II)
MNTTSVQKLDFGFVSAYLLHGEKGFVLVDSGTEHHRIMLADRLAQAGCAKGDLALVVLTHADYDHAGNCAWLRETYGAKIAVHEGDAPMLETGIAPRRSIRGFFGPLLTFLVNLRKVRNPACAPDLRLVDGQDLGEWGVQARIVHLPGHTPGAIGVLVGETDFLAGDVYANWRKPAASPFVHDVEAYRASLAKARTVVPATATVWPGHGGPFPASALAGITI